MSLTDDVKAAAPNREHLGRIAELLANSGIDIAEIGRIEKVRIGEYQMLTKNDEGEAEIHDLRADSLVLTPAWESGPEWPAVQPAKPCVVKPPAAAAKKAEGWQTAVILPDPQIGFRRYEDGTLDPFHDEAAMSVALQIVRHLRPDRVVNLGDFLDLAELSTFEQLPEFQQTIQPAIDRAHRFLAQQRAAAPEATIDLIEGNHDARLPRSIAKNFMAALRLRRAEAPDTWPVLSVPHLLRLDELGVTYHSGYPAATVWLNDNLCCIHGHKVRSAASTAAAVIDDERVSTVFGHVHRLEMQSKTRRTRDGAKQAWAATPGCLCRIDGAVPSTKSAVDIMGRPVPTVENWAQGVGVATYDADGRYALELVQIYSGEAVFRGRAFSAQGST